MSFRGSALLRAFFAASSASREELAWMSTASMVRAARRSVVRAGRRRLQQLGSREAGSAQGPRGGQENAEAQRVCSLGLSGSQVVGS